jgi:P27 family predicted phage terminase small subunit
MTRGRKAKPAAKARAQGNPGRRPIKTSPKRSGATSATAPAASKLAATTAPPASPYPAPDWLDETARGVWSLAIPRLDALGYLRETDHPAFARYCDHTSRWLRLRDKVNEKGESYWTKSKHGKMLRRNPDFQNLLALETVMRALEDRFGLAPVSREAILGRLSDPANKPDPSKRPAGAGAAPGMPSSPVGMLSPSAFARSPRTGGPH